MRIPKIESSLLASILLGVVTPLFGIAAYLAAREYEEDRSVAVFGELLARQTADVEQEVVGLIEGLHTIGALFRSSEEVTREEFGVFTRDILDRHPEILAIEWAPRVTAEERASHERAVRLEGPTRYRISARRPDGSSEAAPLAEEHYPVLYLEPCVENLPALGLDLASEAVRRDALYRAIDTGEPTLTEPIELVQDPGNPGGALILLAVRDERQTPGTTGRAATLGLVLLAVRHRDVAEVAICRDHGRTPDRMYLRLFDEDSGKPLAILYSNTTDDEDLAQAPWTSSSRISIGGRHWVARAAPTELFLDEHRSTQPLFLGLTVFLITGLLYGTFLVLWRRSRRGALRRRDRFMSRVLSNLQEGVIVGDQHGRIRFVNDPIRRIMGPVIPESPAEWSKACGCYMSDGQTPYPAGELPLVRAIRGEIVDPEDIFVLNDHNPDGLWLSVSGTPMLGESGEPRGGVVLIRDITESREKQAHLQRLSNALDQTADMVVITDRGGKIIYVNPAFSKQTGYAAEEALGNTPRILRSGIHDTVFYDELWTTLLSGKVFRSIITNRKKNGSEYKVDQVITPIANDHGEVTHFVTVGRDMTDRLRWEEQAMEMRMASLVQERLYPQTRPHFRGLDVAGTSRPAVETCGDYYDFILGPDGRIFLAIGDICGHGLGPALLMAETRAYLRSLIEAGGEIHWIVERLNALLEPDLADNYFVTLLLVEIDRDGERLRYVNAGHTDGYLVDRQGSVKGMMTCSGVALGITPDSKYDCPDPLDLEPNDTLLLLTDGIVEARSGDRDFFGTERALSVLRHHRDESADCIVDRLGKAVEEFTGDVVREDDQTVLVCKRVSRRSVRERSVSTSESEAAVGSAE